MLESITRIQTPLNFLLNQDLICHSHYQISARCHIFKTSFSSLYVVTLPCILVTRQQHLDFSVFTSGPTSLLASIKVSMVFFMVSILSPSRFTSSA
jgi:hypothetical protein